MLDTPTTLIPKVPQPPPVFVDPSGRRRTRLRRLAYGIGLAGIAYTAMVGASFAGGPVSPENVLPFVESTQHPGQPPLTDPASAPATGDRAESGTGGRPTPRSVPSSSATATAPATPSQDRPSSSPRPSGTPATGRAPSPSRSPVSSPTTSPAAEPPAAPPQPLPRVGRTVPAVMGPTAPGS